MRKLLFLSALFICVPFIAYADLIGSTVATVNLTKTEAVTESQVNKKLKELQEIGTQSGIAPEQITRENVTESLIDQILIKQAAERDGIEVTESQVDQMISEQRGGYEQSTGQGIGEEEFKRVVQKETGYSWREYRRQIKDQILQQMYITNTKRHLFENIDPPTEEQIEEQYRENATRFTNPEYARVSQVFISTQGKGEEEVEEARKKMQKAYREYSSGELSFSDLVLKYTEDEGSKFRGGDVGYITRDNTQVRSAYGRTFFNTVFSLEEGDVSRVIESNQGLHILKVTEHEDAKLLMLQDRLSPDSQVTLRDYLRRMLYQQKQQEVFRRAMDEIVSELRSEADIARFDD
ncbi:MAG: peptidylprolyl isomerase [Spirochaetaceae bacterium]